MLHFVTSYMKQNKSRKQTLESAQYGLEISFKMLVKKFYQRKTKTRIIKKKKTKTKKVTKEKCKQEKHKRPRHGRKNPLANQICVMQA